MITTQHCYNVSWLHHLKYNGGKDIFIIWKVETYVDLFVYIAFWSLELSSLNFIRQYTNTEWYLILNFVRIGRDLQILKEFELNFFFIATSNNRTKQEKHSGKGIAIAFATAIFFNFSVKSFSKKLFKSFEVKCRY